jgi:iron complex transport system permease protein
VTRSGATTAAQAALPAWATARSSGTRLLVGGVLLLVAVVIFAATQGYASIPPHTALFILLNRLPLVAIDTDAPLTWDRIVVDIRLPRIVAAGLVGAALAHSGAAYQGVFRNPLVESSLLGVSAGAALGASIAIVSPLAVDAYGFGWVPLFAFAGGLIAVAVVYLIARVGRAVSNATLILAGVALSAILSAGTSFLLLTSGERARGIFTFLFGGFNTANWERITVALPYLVVGFLLITIYTRALNVLALDEEQASQLGVDVGRTKLIVLAAASLMAATSVAVAGIIGFVGLIVPHAARMLLGVDHRRLLPASALLGASFLILADVLARTVRAPEELPVGIVTAIAGGPFFLWLLRTRRVDGLR